MSTWFPWAIKAPAPPEKSGYPGIPNRPLAAILYMVCHSAEGWESYLKQGHRPGELASWMFSNCQNGNIYQHYPIEAIVWTSGSPKANIEGLAVENEGVKGQPLNDKQVANLRRLRADVAPLCPNLRPPVLGQGFREHSELSGGATSCPSGRIQPLYDSYKMPVQEDYMEIINHKGNYYIPGQYGLTQVTPDYYNALTAAGVPIRATVVDDAKFAQLQAGTKKQMELFPAGSGFGMTPSQVQAMIEGSKIKTGG